MSIEKSIGWTDKTINPIKGLCKGGCWYCWATSFYKMKRLTPKIRLDCSQFQKLPKAPKKIFLCSTHDLFGDWIPSYWTDNIFYYIRKYPQHTFQILTKFPENVDRSMPDNVWLGVTLDGIDPLGDVEKTWKLRDMKAKIKFYSFEPLIGLPCLKPMYAVDWMIVGKLSLFGKRHEPKRRWIEEILDVCKSMDTPIFMKDNLKDVWGEKLIQEFPE